MSSSKNPVPIPQQDDKKETWGEWRSRKYNEQYTDWKPWAEDQYLRWFGKDNKASYATKDALGKTKVTGIEQVDTLQDGVNNTAASQLGKGGLLQPIGDMASKEGFNRAERGGKDEKGNSAPGSMSKVANPVAENAKTGGNAIMDGAKGAGGYVSGLWGGKQGEK